MLIGCLNQLPKLIQLFGKTLKSVLQIVGVAQEGHGFICKKVEDIQRFLAGGCHQRYIVHKVSVERPGLVQEFSEKGCYIIQIVWVKNQRTVQVRHLPPEKIVNLDQTLS